MQQQITDRDFDNFSADGDLLDQVIMEDFDLKPRYAGYQVIRDLINMALKKPDVPLNVIVDNYAESLNKETNDIFVILAVCFKYSKKRLIRNGSSIYSLQLILDRYKAVQNKNKKRK